MTTITTDEVMVLEVKQAWQRQRFRQHEQRLVEECSQRIHGHLEDEKKELPNGRRPKKLNR
jgi:hypothetical protein